MTNENCITCGVIQEHTDIFFKCLKCDNFECEICSVNDLCSKCVNEVDYNNNNIYISNKR